MLSLLLCQECESWVPVVRGEDGQSRPQPDECPNCSATTFRSVDGNRVVETG